MRITFTITLSLLFLVTVAHLQADELTPTEITATPDDWTTSKTDPTAYAVVTEVPPARAISEENLIEIVNDGSISTTKTFLPQNSGRLTFSAKHNKSGLLYIYAQTSDNGGQLLFSIQFTESRGILLEESNRQIELMPNYTANHWYEFMIDFDSTRGQHGMFSVTIDGTLYGEYEYVQSESDLFDLAQITLGSESSGAMSVSAVTDSFFVAPDTATTTASDALLQLSISLSSTSISSNLDNGLLVTASLDGIASVAVTPVATTSSTTDADTATNTAPDTEESNGTGLGGFLLDIVESVIDIFVPDDTTSTKPPETPLPEAPADTEPLPTIEPEIIPSPEENTVQSTISTISTDDTNHADLTTSTF